MPVEPSAHTLWAGLHGNLALPHSLFDDSSLGTLLLDLAASLQDSLVSAAPERNGPGRRPRRTPCRVGSGPLRLWTPTSVRGPPVPALLSCADGSKGRFRVETAPTRGRGGGGE